MKTETKQIPPEVLGNLRYAEMIEAVTELGLAMIELEDELGTIGFSDARILFLTYFADGKIGQLRQKLLLLQTASYEGRLDEWLGIVGGQTEMALEPVTALIAFARKDETKLLTEEYAQRIELANSGLKELYRLWGIPLSEDEDNHFPQLVGRGD